MKEKIKKTIAESLKINPSIITEDLGPGDIPEWDSLAHQNLILALEKDFEVRLDIDEVLEMETFGDIVEILKEKA